MRIYDVNQMKGGYKGLSGLPEVTGSTLAIYRSGLGATTVSDVNAAMTNPSLTTDSQGNIIASPAWFPTNISLTPAMDMQATNMSDWGLGIERAVQAAYSVRPSWAPNQLSNQLAGMPVYVWVIGGLALAFLFGRR